MEKRGKIPKDVLAAAHKLRDQIQTRPTVRETLAYHKRTRTIDLGISPDGSQCLVPYTAERGDDFMRFQLDQISGSLYFYESTSRKKVQRRRIPGSLYND